MEPLTGEQSCDWFDFWLDGFSWLLLIVLGFSSIVLPEYVEEEGDKEPADLRLLFIPADDHKSLGPQSVILTAFSQGLKHNLSAILYSGNRVCLLEPSGK